MAIEIGRVCIKTAGRDAGNYCVVVDAQDDNFVLIDGGTRRRKCNILHLEPTTKQIELSKGASHEAVAEAFKGLHLPVWETKAKTKQPRPLRQKKVKEKLFPCLMSWRLLSLLQLVSPLPLPFWQLEQLLLPDCQPS